MKVFFIAVFDNENKSTNNSQAVGFENAGADVVRYSFRDRIARIGIENVGFELHEALDSEQPDLVVFSKCAEFSNDLISEISSKFKTCYWYMDPPSSVSDDILKKAGVCSYAAIAWKKNLETFKEHNENTFVVIEGFDPLVDTPTPAPEDWPEFDVSFIGSLHSGRDKILSAIEQKVTVIQGAFGKTHAAAVGSTKINLNMSTNGGASDRVFKVLAAGGFLLTDNFVGLNELFEDGKHLVVYDGTDDLQEKINYYLNNSDEAKKIANAGLKAVQKFSRDEWAKAILELSKNV